MADEKMFSNGRVSVWWVPAGGIANINAPTAAEINAGVKLSGGIAWENFALAADSSEDQDDPGLLDVGKSTTRGAAQYGATLEFFYPTNLDDINDPYVTAFNTFKTPRQYGYLVERIGENTPGVQDNVVAGQDVNVFYFVADTFRNNTDGDDSVKFTVVFQPQGQLAVWAKVAGTTLSVAPATLAQDVGDTNRLVASVSGTGYGKDVSAGAKWTSSDYSIATVNSHGIVTGLAAGTATITATYPGTTGTATSSVTVS